MLNNPRYSNPFKVGDAVIFTRLERNDGRYPDLHEGQEYTISGVDNTHVKILDVTGRIFHDRFYLKDSSNKKEYKPVAKGWSYGI